MRRARNELYFDWFFYGILVKVYFLRWFLGVECVGVPKAILYYMYLA